MSAALREKLSYKEVAIKFGITPTLVHRLLKFYKDDPESLQKYEAKQKGRQAKVNLTVTAAQEVVSTQHNLWKASQVSELVARQSGLKVSNTFVCGVLRNVFRMRYKRVVHIAPQANSEASLVKRMESARVLLKELKKGKRCLNIDESGIGAMDFRR